jgi:uncharacterized membrane protein YkvA (DUF1232 family)
MSRERWRAPAAGARAAAATTTIRSKSFILKAVSVDALVKGNIGEPSMTNDYKLSNLRQDLWPVLKRMPSYAKLIRLLASDPRLSGKQKTKLAAGLGYMVSPIDLVPGFIPVLGQLDDVLAVLLLLRNVLRSSPREIVEPYLIQTELTRELIDEDISTSARVLRAVSITLVKKTGRGLAKAGRYLRRKIKGSRAR